MQHLPNPNVLIELGYAKKALSPLRLIQVWNTLLTGCSPEDLPFDMRGRRGPLAFRLTESDDHLARKRVTDQLSRQLVDALKLIVIDEPKASSSVNNWAEADPHDKSIWPNENGEMLLNEPGHGSGTKRVFPPPRSFVRILPNRWTGSDELDRHDLLIEMSGGFSWGATVDGVLTYPGSILFDDTSKVHAITKRFEKTGELWATRTDLARKFGDHLCIRGDSIPEGWLKYLAYALPHMTKGGAEWPLKVLLGIVGLGGCHWPTDASRGRPPAALRTEFVMEFTLTEKTIDDIWQPILESWCGYRKIFTIPPPAQSKQEEAKHFLKKVIGDSLSLSAD